MNSPLFPAPVLHEDPNPLDSRKKLKQILWENSWILLEDLQQCCELHSRQSLMGFGFVIAKFVIFLHALEGKPTSAFSTSLIAGEIMIVVGIITIGYGFYEYSANEKDIENTGPSRHTW